MAVSGAEGKRGISPGVSADDMPADLIAATRNEIMDNQSRCIEDQDRPPRAGQVNNSETNNSGQHINSHNSHNKATRARRKNLTLHSMVDDQKPETFRYIDKEEESIYNAVLTAGEVSKDEAGLSAGFDAPHADDKHNHSTGGDYATPHHNLRSRLSDEDTSIWPSRSPSNCSTQEINSMPIVTDPKYTLVPCDDNSTGRACQVKHGPFTDTNCVVKEGCPHPSGCDVSTEHNHKDNHLVNTPCNDSHIDAVTSTSDDMYHAVRSESPDGQSRSHSACSDEKCERVQVPHSLDEPCETDPLGADRTDDIVIQTNFDRLHHPMTRGPLRRSLAFHEPSPPESGTSSPDEHAGVSGLVHNGGQGRKGEYHKVPHHADTSRLRDLEGTRRSNSDPSDIITDQSRRSSTISAPESASSSQSGTLPPKRRYKKNGGTRVTVSTI